MTIFVQKIVRIRVIKVCAVVSVVKPFHFGPAPAPASQDGGFSSSSSSSPVFHNLLLKKMLENLAHQFTGLVLITEMYECFALLFQYFA